MNANTISVAVGEQRSCPDCQSQEITLLFLNRTQLYKALYGKWKTRGSDSKLNKEMREILGIDENGNDLPRKKGRQVRKRGGA